MKILSIELSGYKRIMMNQSAIFRMILTQKIQLILGTNGSGKSSLISELSPLPANGADFEKGGSKIISILNGGNSYVLKNIFDTKTGKHSFEKNGVELNQGQTVSAQRELIWQEFRINDEIRGLQLGREKFTEMKPGRRREWLTMLSDTNFDYALGIYAQVREQQRDAVGALKRTKARLVNETAKLITPEEQEKLKKEVEAIHNELSELLEHKAPIEHNRQDLEHQQEKGLAQLNEMSYKLLKMQHYAPFTAYGADEAIRDDWGVLQTPTFKSIADIDQYLARLKERIAAEEALINQSVKDHEKLKNNLGVLKKTGENGLQTLSIRLNKLIEEKHDVLKQRKLKLEGFDVQAALISLNSCEESLFEIFSTIAQNEDKKYSQAKLTPLQDELKNLRETMLRFRTQLDKLEAEKAHLESHATTSNVECPECHHRFVPGFVPGAIQKLGTRIEDGTKKLKELAEQITKREGQIEEFNQYGQLYRQYLSCVKGYEALNPFWAYLDEESLPIKAPRMVMSLVTTLKQDLQIEEHAKRIDLEITEVKNLMAQATLIGDASITDTQTKMDEIGTQVEAMTTHLSRLRQRFNEHQSYRKQLAEAMELGGKIDLLTRNLTLLTADIVETMRRETIQHCIRQLQSQLGKKEEALNAVKLQTEVIRNLDEEIKSLELDNLAWKAIGDKLSPIDGLIAEGLMGFIKNYTRQMNQFIRQIWSYPLVVKECGVSGNEGVELDYKFPMVVGTVENVIDDISLGSSGMKDIIDLAFVNNAMKYWGIPDSSFFLDEFAITLDKEHRTKATDAIKSMMDTQSFSQLFMISHYESMYGAFANAEICVLDSKNIVVPDIYNQHVTIQ
jgi:DNA repair exonuclease SbcCD ATPase subunit